MFEHEQKRKQMEKDHLRDARFQTKMKFKKEQGSDTEMNDGRNEEEH